MQADSQWLLSKTIAHRGLHDDLIPENTLMAFQKAVEKDYAIELDVHITLDEKLVVFHDDNISRLMGVNRRIEECTLSELKAYQISGTSERIPTIEEVLKTVNGKVPILIEIKNGGEQGKIENLLCEVLKKYPYEYAIQSFNPFSVKWLKDNAPEIVRGQLSGNYLDPKMSVLRKIVLKYCLTNLITKPHFINYDIKLMPNILTKICKFWGYPVLGWTARTKDDRKAIKYCDNLVMEGEAINLGPLKRNKV